MAIDGKIRATLFFEAGRFGLTETHINQSDGELSTLVDAAIRLYKKRMAIMGYGVEPFGIRLSKEGVFRDSLIIGLEDIADTAPTLITYGGSGQYAATNKSDQAKSCVLVRAQSTPLAKKNLFLAGVPDLLIGDNNKLLNVGNVPGWLTAFKAYEKELKIGNWGFRARQQPNGDFAPRPISLIDTDTATGAIEIITTSGLALFAVNDVVQIRAVKRVANNFRQLNGMWKISAVLANTPINGQQTYLLANSSAWDSSQYMDTGTIQKVDYVVAGYVTLQLTGATTRKRGNRFLAGPGRRKAAQPARF